MPMLKMVKFHLHQMTAFKQLLFVLIILMYYHYLFNNIAGNKWLLTIVLSYGEVDDSCETQPYIRCAFMGTILR